MIDRIVKTTLTAKVDGYLQGMDLAARKTREMGSEAEKLAAKRQAFQTLGASAIALGVAVAAAVGLAVVKYADFDQAMSNANAVLQESVEGQRALRDAALEAGGATVFTAREAANGVEELGKAGIGTADILSGALTGSLDLAASGQLGVARASEITGITLKQFALDGTQAARVADVLSAGANKAVGSVEDLAQGLKFVGPVAAGMNVSLEDSVATLALFADRGVIGEQAGTSFRGMLSSLTSPSKMARDELDRLNITLYDAETKRFLGVENAAGELQRALGGVSDAERDMSLGILFGNQQLTAARILVDAGAATWRDYRDSVDDTGIAARVAAERMDNLAGDVEKLGGAFDTALIKTGSGANDVLRGLVQTATLIVDAIGGIPEPVLGVGLALATATAAVALLGGTALLAVPKVAAFKATLEEFPGLGKKVGLGVSVGTAAFVAAGIAVSIWASETGKARAEVDAYATTLDSATRRVTSATREMVKENLAAKQSWWFIESDSIFDNAKRLGLSLETVTDAAMGNADALREVQEALRTGGVGSEDYNQKLEELGLTTTEYGNAVNAVERGIAGQNGSIEEAIRVAEQKASVDREAAAATDVHERALAGLEGRAESTAAEIDDLADRIRGFGSAQFDLREANRSVEQSLDDFREALAENGHTLDITTDAGRANESAADDLAQAYLDQAAAVGIQQGSLEAALPVLAAGREAFINETAAALGSRDAAVALADSLGLIPEHVEYLIESNTTQAQADLDNFIVRNDGRRIRIYADGSINFGGAGNQIARAQGGFEDHRVSAFAQGGMPSGIYSNGPIYKFAEKHLPWEAYISPDPAYRQKNLDILGEVGERLGAWRSMPAGGSQQGGGGLTSQQIDQLGRVIAANLPKQGPVALLPASIREIGREVGESVESRTELLIRAGLR